MAIDKTTLRIIQRLLSSQDYISSYQISESVGMSRRLVRDKMADVRSALDNLGYTLSSYPSKGYLIPFKDLEARRALEVKIIDIEKGVKPLIPQYSDERRDYIILRLLRQEGYVKIDTLAEELAVSRATISNDIKLIKANYQHRMAVIIRQKPNFGIRFDMKELGIRQLYLDTIFKQFSSEKIFYEFLGTSINPSNQLENRIMKIIDENFGLSDIALTDFLLYISIACQRIHYHHELTEVMDISDFEDRVEFPIAKTITEWVEEALGVTFNAFEQIQLGIELISRRASFSRSLHSNTQYYPLLDQIYQEINQQLVIDFSKDPGLRELLSAYLPSLFFRVQFNTKLRTPHYLSVQNKYPLAYECAKICAKHLLTQFGFDISSSEYVHLSIFFQNAILEMGYFKKRAYVVCGMGRGATEMIRHQLTMWFSTEIEVVRVAQYYVFKDIAFNQIDLVISMTPIYDHIPVPILTISQMYDDEDRQKIRDFLDTHYNLPSIKTLFTPTLYFPKTTITKKMLLIKQFIKVLSQTYKTIDHTIFSSVMYDEKRRTCIEYDHGTTIVQLNFSISSGPVVCVFHLEQPMIWESKPATTIIFVSLRSKANLAMHSLKRTFSHFDGSVNLTQLNYSDFIRTLLTFENTQKQDKKITYEVIP